MKRRTFVSALGGLLAVAAEGQAAQSGGRSYAVVSLVGDKINVVAHRMATGSNTDQNARESMPVTEGLFDKDALLAADDSLKRAEPGATVRLLAVASPALFENQSRFFEGDKVALPGNVMNQIRSAGTTRLILITKYHHEARLRLRANFVGSGFLEGLGFYIDRSLQVIDAQTRETSRGFLGPFVYIELRLIDLSTSTVLRTKAVTESNTFTTARSASAVDPWDALTSAEKLDTLRNMLSSEVERAIPELIAGP